MARRTLAALLAILAATACTGGGASPEATPSPPAATAASAAPTASPTPGLTPIAQPTPGLTPTAQPTPGPTPTASPTPGPAPTASPTPGLTPTASPTPGPAPTAAPTPDASPTATVTPSRTSFGEGKWRVGVDIAPGRYRAWAWYAECAWSTGSGKEGAALSAGTIVEIAPSDRTFLSRGCGEWTAHPRPDVTPGQPFGDGDYLVGVDIAPGRYRATADAEHCHWRIGALVDKEQGPSATIVDIRPSDRIFSTARCGAWTNDLTPRITPGQPFGDGTWLVGSEIAPGRYRTTSDTCAWRVWPGTGFVSETGAAWRVSGGDIVDIDPTDAGFTSRGCEWTADLTPRITPGEPFGDGAWLVGSEIAPGLYVAAGPEHRCRWTHLRGRGEADRPGASASVAGIAEIGPGDIGFRSMDCGEWKPYAGPAVEPGQPFGDGVFLVGAEIAPGSWRAVSPTDECRWERLREDGGSRFYPGPYAGPGITLFFGGYGGWIARIAPDDVGFASRGCGTWEPIPIASFGDGEHRVGADIPPGLYRASAPTEECEWERRDAGGVTGYGDSSIPIAEVALARLIDKGERWAEPRDPVFASSGCGTWTNDPAPRITPGQPFGDGAWLVGSEIAPGRYRAIDPSESCRWQRVRGFRDPYHRGWFASGAWGGASPNIAGGDVTGVADVTSLDAAFVSRGCGAWTRDLQPITEPGEPFGDGTYLVWIDIAPGRYRAYYPASAPEGSFACEWERRSDFASDAGYTYGRLPLANGAGSEGMAVLTVDIAESDAGFHSEGCGTWTAELTPAATPGEPFGDGEWIVGLDIAPGRYRAHSPSDSCRWNRLSGFGGHSFLPHETDAWGRIEAIEGSHDLDDPGEVAIAPSDAGFASRDCGAWTPVPP